MSGPPPNPELSIDDLDNDLKETDSETFNAKYRLSAIVSPEAVAGAATLASANMQTPPWESPIKRQSPRLRDPSPGQPPWFQGWPLFVCPMFHQSPSPFGGGLWPPPMAVQVVPTLAAIFLPQAA